MGFGPLKVPGATGDHKSSAGGLNALPKQFMIDQILHFGRAFFAKISSGLPLVGFIYFLSRGSIAF